MIVEASEETLGQLTQLMSNLGYALGDWLSKEQEYKEQNKDFHFQALDAL